MRKIIIYSNLAFAVLGAFLSGYALLNDKSPASVMFISRVFVAFSIILSFYLLKTIKEK